jgi:site-specific DNA recombinase
MVIKTNLINTYLSKGGNIEGLNFSIKYSMVNQIKYIIYCRKSSEQEDRQILSLPAQEKELLEFAQNEKLTVIAIYKESQSAHRAGRSLFNEMLLRIEKGEAQGIIVWDESRLSRNTKDGGTIVYMMDLEQLIEIRKPGKTYKNTPDDKSWLQMCFMMSKKESDDKGVNVKRGLRTKADQGWFPSSWTKPGYIWDRMAERGNKTLLNDPVRFPLIKKCWELMATGAYTPPQILNKLNNEWGYRTLQRKTIGGGPMQRSEIYRVFADPFYYGYFEYPVNSGTWHKGQHEPMITKQVFDFVQVLLGRKGSTRPQTKYFPFTGLIKCGECGAMITAEERWQCVCSKCKHKFSSTHRNACPKCNTAIEDMATPIIRHYIHYHCTKRKNPDCTQGSIDANLLETQLTEFISGINISAEFKDWAIKYLNELNESETESRNATLTSLQLAYNACVKRMDNLLTLKISANNIDGSLLSDEEYKTQKNAITLERMSIEDKIKNINVRMDDWIGRAEGIFDFAVHARQKFTEGTAEEKRIILVTIGSDFILEDKKLRLNVQKPYVFIEEMVKSDDSIRPRFGTEKESVLTTQMETSWSQNLSLLPG